MIMMDFGSALDDWFTSIFLMGAIVVGIIWGIVSWIDDDAIRSKHPIQPKLELVIENNQVDTVYVYEQP